MALINKTLIGSVILGMALVGCTEKPQPPSAKETAQITIGSHGADLDVWNFIASSQATKDAGLTITVKDINDGVALNDATATGDVDVNAFQSWAYFQSYNNSHGNKLTAIATTYYEPMGIYSQKHQHLNDIPIGASVAIPADTANYTRALYLLQAADLIQLPANFNEITVNVNDITNNPKKLTFQTVKYAHGPRVLPDVDISVIGNAAALDGGLNVFKDALFYEQNNESINKNINILVAKNSEANNPNLLKLAALYHSQAVVDYIAEHFGGTKVAVNKPVENLVK